jgi:hypothetical protein
MPGRPAQRAAFYFLKVARAAAFIKKKGECLQEKKRRANVKRSAGRKKLKKRHKKQKRYSTLGISFKRD